MNLYETKDFFKKLYPNKEVLFEFDNNCIRSIEITQTEGKAHLYHHIDYDKLKVTPNGDPSVYIPISNHREVCTFEWIKNHINTILTQDP